MKVAYVDGMKIIGEFPFVFPGYIMNFFGAMVSRRKIETLVAYFNSPRGKVTINHEKIHTHQMKYMGYVFFYIVYFIEWLIRLVTPPMKTAYMDISFEREAYTNQNDMDYVEKMKPFSWTKYIFTRKKKSSQ